MISGRSKRKADRRRAPRDPMDRHNTKVSYIGVICDSAWLQPILPQVILPRYSQHGQPPPHVLEKYAEFGYPFEFWHGTAGAVTPGIIQAWMTRLRSVISSFNPTAWIILVMDCDASHMCLKTITHLRRIGIVPVVVPAKLTWLLQVLDVYVFGSIKKDMRLQELKMRTESGVGQIEKMDKMKSAIMSIRRSVINRDWSTAFNKLGYGNDDHPTAKVLEDYLPGEVFEPMLPSLAEFGVLTSRPVHTQMTQSLYRMFMKAALELAAAPVGACPPRGAHSNVPASREALPIASRQDLQHRLPEEVLHEFVHGIDEAPLLLSGPGAARNVFIDKNGSQNPED